MTITLFFLGILFFLLVIKFPIIFSVIVSAWLILKYVVQGIPVEMISQKLVGGCNSFPLLAIPFFMLAANIMTSTSITKRLVEFVNVTIGFVKSGLAIVNVVVSMIFAGMSGSSTADTAGASSLIMTGMIEEGYDRPFSVAVTGASSTIGVIIPPSIPLVIYAFCSNTSVGALFLAGIIPGTLIGISQIIICIWRGTQRNYPCKPRIPFSQVILAGFKAIPVLVLPLIILGGIFGGIFTATEAAVVAVFYAIGLSIFLKELTLSKLYKALLEAGVTSSLSILLIGATTPFSWLLAYNHIPQIVVSFISSISTNPITVLSLITIFLLIAGTVMDNIPIMLITIPIFFPLVRSLGISPILFGTIMNVALAIGLVTPPVGGCLFVACAVGKTTISEVIGEFMPFYIVMIIVLFLLILFPQLTLYFPLKFMPGSV